MITVLLVITVLYLAKIALFASGALRAAEMGCELLKTDDGLARLHVMMLDDIQIALQHGHVSHANELADTYRRFRSAHPLQGIQVSSL